MIKIVISIIFFLIVLSGVFVYVTLVRRNAISDGKSPLARMAVPI